MPRKLCEEEVMQLMISLLTAVKWNQLGSPELANHRLWVERTKTGLAYYSGEPEK